VCGFMFSGNGVYVSKVKKLKLYSSVVMLIVSRLWWCSVWNGLSRLVG